MALDCIGFFTNPERPSYLETVKNAIAAAEKLGFRCSVDACLSGLLPGIKTFSQVKPQLIAAFGGDGTILRAARGALCYDIPILGVNLGRVGFLSEVQANDFEPALCRIKDNDYSTERHMTLSCRLGDGSSICSLNDVLLYKRSFSGVLDISVEVDGADAGSVFCDGLIVSTPTGATGYSISAGGPVIAPGLEVAIITPICPHTLGFRPIIVPPNGQMRFVFNSSGCISADGIAVADLDKGDSVVVLRGQNDVNFVRLAQRNLYSLIRNKLA